MARQVKTNKFCDIYMKELLGEVEGFSVMGIKFNTLGEVS